MYRNLILFHHLQLTYWGLSNRCSIRLIRASEVMENERATRYVIHPRLANGSPDGEMKPFSLPVDILGEFYKTFRKVRVAIRATDNRKCRTLISRKTRE